MDIASLPPWPGIAGRTAVVTGASRGIGRSIAEGLAAQGALVVGTATTEAGAAAISAWLGQKGRGMVLDVRSDDSVAAVIRDVTERHEAPTILVNNAGITKDNLLARMNTEQWDDVISTNLSSVYRVCQAALRGMLKARHGRIINIGSVIGLIGNPGQANYAAAKAGIIAFSKSLAREVATRNITVNTVAPGFVSTDMTAALPQAQIDALKQQIPSGQLGTAADIAAAVIYLASDAARYVTGETLNVNGGLHMQ